MYVYVGGFWQWGLLVGPFDSAHCGVIMDGNRWISKWWGKLW